MAKKPLGTVLPGGAPRAKTKPPVKPKLSQSVVVKPKPVPVKPKFSPKAPVKPKPHLTAPIKPAPATTVQAPKLERNLQDPDYLFYNLLNNGKFSAEGKKHYEDLRRQRFAENIGYEPTFWENPTRVARYYNAIKNAPPEWVKPDWLDVDGITTAYDYLKFRNEDKPWHSWKYLPVDDPGRAYMQSLGQPPDDPSYILDQYLSGLPLTEYERPAEDISQSTAETITAKWDTLPSWQKFFLTIGMPTGGVEGRPELSRFTAAGVQGGLAAMGGAAIGTAILPGVGTVAGALLLGVPTGVLSYFGSPYVPVLSDILNVFNLPAMGAMQAYGVAKQAVGSITNEELYGSFAELLDEMPEAWKAAKITYMTQPNWLFDVAAKISGDEPAGPGQVWQFQKGITEPVDVDDIRTEALVDYRRRLAAGENEADLYSEYVDKYGFSGTFNDFLYQSILDPLQLSPYASSRAGTAITRAVGQKTGNLGIQRLSKTFEAGQGSLLVDLMPMGLNYLVSKVTGKPGSQGIVDTWRTFQNNVYRNFPTAGIPKRPPSELTAFEKFAGNLTPEGRWKALEPTVRRKGLAGYWDYIANLTNDSKARLFLFGMHDNLGFLLNEAKGDPAEMNRMLDLVARPEPADISEAASSIINSPMAATIQAALREAIREGTPSRMLADWMQNEGNRNLLVRLAEVTGTDPAKALEAVTKDANSVAVDLLRRAQAQPDNTAIQDLLRSFQLERGMFDPQATAAQIANALKDRLGVFMGENPAPWHPDEYQANLVNHIFDQADGWLKTRFDLKPDAAVFRLSGVLKSLQSLVLLGLNPAYFINNAVNNIVTRASQGVFGFMSTKHINDYWTRMGFEPSRLGVGIGAAGEGAISSGLDAVGRLTAGGGFLGKAQNQIGKLNKMGVFSRLSSKFEGFESRQAYTIGAMRFMQRNWKRGIGFNKMDAGLEARLRAIHPQLPEVMYGIVEAGLNPNEITGKILQGAIVRDVGSYVDDAARRLYPDNPQLAKDLLNTIGVSGELTRRLQGATSREQVNRVFADVESRMQEWIDLRVAQGLADQAGNAEAQVRAAGVSAVLPMFSDMVERIMYGWLTHLNGWAEVFAETADMAPAERGARIRAYAAQTSAEWRRIHAFERQTYQGIHRALGIQDATAAEFLRLLNSEHQLWEHFYDGFDTVENGVTTHTQGVNDLYREFFERNYESYEARKIAWDTLQQRMNELYEASVQRERSIELAIDEEYVGLWERFTGRDASDLLLHRENVRAIRDEMTNSMTAFRQQLFTLDPPRDIRRQMWTEFMENTYRPLIQQLKYQEIIGASRLAGQEPPLGTIPPPDVQQPGMPVFITDTMRTQLAEIGYTPEQIRELSPAQAWQIIEQSSRPTGGEAPPPTMSQTAVPAIEVTPSQAIRNIAHRYGVPTADVRGKPLDIVVKRIVRKYTGQEFDRLGDIPPDLAEQAFIARQEAKANPVVERAEIDVADHIDAAHQDGISETQAANAEIRASGRLNRRMSRELFVAVFDAVPEADIDFIMFMVDQHADSWAVEHGYEPGPATRDLWWATHLEDVQRIANDPGVLNTNLMQKGKVVPQQPSFFEETMEDMPLFSGTPDTAKTEVFNPGEGLGEFIRSNTIKVGRDVFEVVLESRDTGVAFFVRRNGAKVLPGEIRYLPKDVLDLGGKMVDVENINRGVQQSLFQQAAEIGSVKMETWFSYDWINDRPGNVRSAVVDSDGVPKVVYHGTPTAGFESFDINRTHPADSYGRGFYFTEDIDIAGQYSARGSAQASTRAVIEAYLSINNPFDINAFYSIEDANQIVGEPWAFTEKTGQQIYDELVARGYSEKLFYGEDGTTRSKDYATLKLQEAGFDGVTYVGGQIIGEGLHKVWIAFWPEQVKQVGNVGEWSPRDQRMLYQPEAGEGSPKGRDISELTQEEWDQVMNAAEDLRYLSYISPQTLPDGSTFKGASKSERDTFMMQMYNIDRYAAHHASNMTEDWMYFKGTEWNERVAKRPAPTFEQYPGYKKFLGFEEPEVQPVAQPVAQPAAAPNEPITIEMLNVNDQLNTLNGSPTELLQRMDTVIARMQKSLEAMPDNDGLRSGIEIMQMKRDAVADGRPYKVVDVTNSLLPEEPVVDTHAKLTNAGYSNGDVKKMTPEQVQVEADRIENIEPSPAITGYEARTPLGIVRAFGPDPNKAYDFRWKIVELDDLVTSHGLDGNVNKAFPADLQRVQKMRGRAASQEQITNIAAKLVPASILGDSNSIQTGAMIVGPDNVVESGNGRTLALRLSVENFPENWAAYQDGLKLRAAELGLNTDGYRNPVLVRERVSDVDRVSFFREANDPTTMRASEFEQGVFDAQNISDDAIINLAVNPEWTIDQALRSPDNDAFTRSFVSSLPENERATMVDKDGRLSAEGLRRIKNAIFLKVYQGDAGFRVAQGFIESIDPLIKNVQNALYATLPVVGKLESSVRKGAIPKNLSIADDIIRVADRMLILAKDNVSVKHYLINYQSGLLGDDLTPIQLGLLRYIHENARQVTRVRKLIENYATGALLQPGGAQTSLIPMEAISKGELLDVAANKLGKATEFAEAEAATIPEKGIESETKPIEGQEEVPAPGERQPAQTSEPTGREETKEVPRGENPQVKPVRKTTTLNRGGIELRRDGRAIIRAFEGSDASTLLHELGHMFRRDLSPELLDVVARSTGLTSGAELSQLEEAFWFGADGKIYTEYQNLLKIEKPDAVTQRRIKKLEDSDAVKRMKRYVASEEHFARGWERYLAEGVAPTPELRTAFEKFTNWLLKIYTRVINSQLDVDIRVQVNGVSLKDVYDRMLTIKPPEGQSLFQEGLPQTPTVKPGAVIEPLRKMMSFGWRIEAVSPEPQWITTGAGRRGYKMADDMIAFIEPQKDGTYNVEGIGTEKNDTYINTYRDFKSEAEAQVFIQSLVPDQVYALIDPAGNVITRYADYDYINRVAERDYLLIHIPEGDYPQFEGIIPDGQGDGSDFYVYRGMSRPEAEAIVLQGEVMSKSGLTYFTDIPREAYGYAQTENVADNFQFPNRPAYVIEVRRSAKMRRERAYGPTYLTSDIPIPADLIARVTEVKFKGTSLDDRAYRDVTDQFKKSLDQGRMLFQRATPVFESVDPFMHGQNEITGRFAVNGTVVAYAPRGMTAPQPMEAGGRTVYLLGIDPDNPAQWVAQDGDNVITIPMRDPLNPVPETPPVGDTELRNVPEIENEGMALHEITAENVMPLLNEIKQGVLRDLGNQPMQMGDVSESDQGQIRGWLNQVTNDLSGAKLAAAGYGELQRDASLLNYSKRYGADNILNLGWPYSLWGTRTIQNWSLRTLDKPTLFGTYARYKEMRRKLETEKNGFPSRFKGKMAIGLPWMPDYMGSFGFFDPVRQLFPPDALVGTTMDFLVREKDQQTGQAVAILNQMVDAGEITPIQRDEANKTRTGEVWNTAYQRAAEELDTRFNNPVDVVNNLFSPALWLSMPSNILQGTPEKINPLPMTRFGQTLQNTTKGTWLEGAGAVTGGLLAGPERMIRKKAGLSEYGEWGDYYVDRWLANMAAEGTFSTKDVLLAMIERRGPAFDEAYRRAGEEQAFRMPGGVMLYGLSHGMSAKDYGPTLVASLFPLGLFPPGELKQRGLYDEYSKAQEDYYEHGKEDALTTFFKDHPEYEARLALWDTPEERLRQFLVSEIWDAYYKLERPNRAKAVEQLGPTFEKTFLDSNTKDYSGLRVDQLAAWAKILRGVVPVVPETKAVDDMGFLLPDLDLYPPELAKAIETYQNERDRLYPGWYMLQSAYFTLPEVQRAGYMTRFPLLKKYWDWKKQYEADHPELKPWFDEQRAKFNTGGSSSSGGGYSGGGSTAPKQPVEKQVLTRSDLNQFSTPLLRQLTSYFLGNVPMGEGALAELERIWTVMGKPNGDMSTWLDTTVSKSFQ